MSICRDHFTTKCFFYIDNNNPKNVNETFGRSPLLYQTFRC